MPFYYVEDVIDEPNEDVYVTESSSMDDFDPDDEANPNNDGMDIEPDDEDDDLSEDDLDAAAIADMENDNDE